MVRGIKVKKLYDGIHMEPFENVTVLFDETGFTDIIMSDESEITGGEQFNIEDKSDLYMMPGLVDCHVHLMLPGDGTKGEYIMRDWSQGEVAVMAYRNAMTALAAGVTTLRDCGGAYNCAVTVKNTFERQSVNGPDILSSGAPLTCTGGHCWYMGGEADGPGEIRKKIRNQQKAGAGFVKLMAAYGGTIGVTKTPTFSDDELQAAIDEAHLRGMKITMHSVIYEVTKKLADMDVDMIEHTVMCDAHSTRNFLDEEVIAKIREKGIFVDHTLNCVNGTVNMYEEKVKNGTATPWEKEQYETYKRYQDLTFESFNFQVERHVPYVVGTDAGWGFSNFRDGYYENIYEMQRNGASAKELIIASTNRAAKAIGFDNILGSVETGKQADFLLLKDDPGVDMAKAIRKPYEIYKRGQIFRS